MRKTSLTWFIVLCMLFASYTAHPDTTVQRAKLKTPPVKIYQSMLRFADEQRYKKLEASLSFIKPVTLSIKKRWDIDIEDEVCGNTSKQDKTATRLSVQKLIFLDMEDLLYKSSEGDQTKEDRRIHIRTAHLNYLLLSPTVKTKDLLADQRIKKVFRGLHRSTGKSPYVRSASDVDSTVTGNGVRAIEKEMIELFPEWRLDRLLQKEEGEDGGSVE